jgi:hypothetical protein
LLHRFFRTYAMSALTQLAQSGGAGSGKSMV